MPRAKKPTGQSRTPVAPATSPEAALDAIRRAIQPDRARPVTFERGSDTERGQFRDATIQEMARYAWPDLPDEQVASFGETDRARVLSAYRRRVKENHQQIDDYGDGAREIRQKLEPELHQLKTALDRRAAPLKKGPAKSAENRRKTADDKHSKVRQMALDYFKHHPGATVPDMHAHVASRSSYSPSLVEKLTRGTKREARAGRAAKK